MRQCLVKEVPSSLNLRYVRMYCTPYLIIGNVVFLTGTCFYRSNLFERPCIWLRKYQTGISYLRLGNSYNKLRVAGSFFVGKLRWCGRNILCFAWNGKAYYTLCISPQLDDPDQVRYSSYPLISFQITVPFTVVHAGSVFFWYFVTIILSVLPNTSNCCGCRLSHCSRVSLWELQNMKPLIMDISSAFCYYQFISSGS